VNGNVNNCAFMVDWHVAFKFWFVNGASTSVSPLRTRLKQLCRPPSAAFLLRLRLMIQLSNDSILGIAGNCWVLLKDLSSCCFRRVFGFRELNSFQIMI
jgi:hypothetical protein